jgi:hypothetical protein
VQGRGGGFRRLLTPELVDQAVARDDLVRPHEQDGEQRTLMRAADPEPAPVSEHLERAEDAELEELFDPSSVPRRYHGSAEKANICRRN